MSEVKKSASDSRSLDGKVLLSAQRREKRDSLWEKNGHVLCLKGGIHLYLPQSQDFDKCYPLRIILTCSKLSEIVCTFPLGLKSHIKHQENSSSSHHHTGRLQSLPALSFGHCIRENALKPLRNVPIQNGLKYTWNYCVYKNMCNLYIYICIFYFRYVYIRIPLFKYYILVTLKYLLR